MTTVSDHIRKGLYNRLGVDTSSCRGAAEVSSEIKRMQIKLQEVAGLANDRLIMGGIRYGSDWEHDPLMDYMQKKFDIFKETGNFEMLVDLFNFVVIEGQLKTHPKFHFKAIDRKD